MTNQATTTNAAREAGQTTEHQPGCMGAHDYRDCTCRTVKDETVGGTIVAISADQCWGKGDTVESAIHQLWKAGASGLQNVLLYAYHGPRHLRQEISVNLMGDVEYPQGLVSVRVGMLKLNPGAQPRPNK